MPKEKVGKIPDFKDSGSQEQDDKEENQKSADGDEEVKQTADDKSADEKDTQENASASEKPAGEKEEQPKEKAGDDVDRAAVDGLTNERNKLLVEIQKLRGVRRDLRQKQDEEVQELEGKKEVKPQEKPEDITIDPRDREIIKQVIESEGYVKKDDAYKTVEQQQLNEWLNEHPEFKVENDPDNENWESLMAEYNLYRKPQDPTQTKEFLEKARKSIPSVTPVNERAAAQAQNRQKMETAGMGAGGAGRSSLSGLSLPQGMKESEVREEYRRGGYSDEEIDEMLKK